MRTLYQKSLSYIEKWMGSFGWDAGHMRQVSRLAASLFDELQNLHGLGEEDRFLLLAGALTHDVGIGGALFDPNGMGRSVLSNSDPFAAHHKSSRDLIMKNDFPGIDQRQKAIIALLARYHRRAKPKARHKIFKTLNRQDQEKVRKLAAILRVADGLDRSHTSTVHQLSCRIEDKRIILTLEVYREPDAEIYGTRKKSGLFEEVFGRKMDLDVRFLKLKND